MGMADSSPLQFASLAQTLRVVLREKPFHPLAYPADATIDCWHDGSERNKRDSVPILVSTGSMPHQV